MNEKERKKSQSGRKNGKNVRKKEWDVILISQRVHRANNKASILYISLPAFHSSSFVDKEG